MLELREYGGLRLIFRCRFVIPKFLVSEELGTRRKIKT